MGRVILAFVMHASYMYPAACTRQFSARLLLIDFQVLLVAAESEKRCLPPLAAACLRRS